MRRRAFLLSVCLAATTAVAQEQDLLTTIRPFESYGHVYDGDSMEAMRPRVMGTHGVLSTGHYLATLAEFKEAFGVQVHGPRGAERERRSDHVRRRRH